MELRPYQVESVQLLRGKLKEGKKAILLCITGGGGKCHGKNTPIKMHDGTIKMVQDIIPGDRLMGDDFTARNVLSVCSGKEELWTVKQSKGISYVCNKSHILSLWSIKDRIFVDISISELIKNLPKSNHYIISDYLGYKNKSRQLFSSIELVLHRNSGEYYGFEIDRNRRYMLSDGTVTHNTVIASHMMEGAIKKGNPVLFIAHRKELIRQCVKKLSNFGINAGIIMSREKENLSRMVQVASIQTLQRRDLPPAALVIVDECHRSISTQYLDILKYYKGTGSTIIGLTGTPFRTNKREGLNSLYDDFVANIQCSLLIEQGFISPVKVYGSGKISSKRMKSQAGEFREAELMKAFDTENVYVNLMINFEKYLKNEKTIVFCCSVAHSLKCTEVFLNAGYTAAHIDGNTPADERDAIVEKFGKGEIQVLLNYGILAEGFDVPDCGGVILNLATKSKIKYLQACWRGSRVSPGKEFYTVIDMADNCERFGFPDEDIEVSLEPESETESSGVAPVKVCPDCSYMSFASAKCCPDCNHEFKKSKKEIEEEEFIELKRKQKEERKKKAWKNYGQKDWHKVSDEDLEEFGRIKKYSPVWAKMELQRRKEGRKIVKIVNYTGNDLYNKQKELQKIYDSKKPIDATEFVFQEETKVHIVFRYVKNQNQEPVNQD